MSYFDKLPDEIKDKIFLLYLDYNDIKNTREYQSDHVKIVTKYDNFDDANKNKNFKNVDWLIEKGMAKITRYDCDIIKKDIPRIVPWNEHTIGSSLIESVSFETTYQILKK